MKENVISIDAETNGLWGNPFAIAAVKYNKEGVEEARFVGRCPIEGDINPWVEENVLPEMGAIEETHASLQSLLADFGKWWLANKEGASAMWHMGHVVETYLFRLMVEGSHIGEWDAPYTPVELSEHLRLAGHAPDSVDSYMESAGIEKPDVEGGSHNPLFDAIAAAKVYFDLQQQ